MKKKNLIQVLLFFALVFCSMQMSYSQSISVIIPGDTVTAGTYYFGYSASTPDPNSLFVILRLDDRGQGGHTELYYTTPQYFYPGTYTVYAEFDYNGYLYWDEKTFVVI
jgi:hypothetical protein